MKRTRYRIARAVKRVIRAWYTRRRRVDALDDIGRILQQDFRCLQNAYLIDADRPGDTTRLECRYMAYVTMAGRLGCVARSLDEREEYID